MAQVITRDGTEIYYKDWGTGDAVIFSHGWPLTADAFEDQMIFLARQGYRVIAHDRRGHGRSSQPFYGNDLDSCADDLAELVHSLDVTLAVHVGHSTGAGEILRYVARHGSARVAGAVLIAAIAPLVLRNAKNPEGLPQEAFEAIRTAVSLDRSSFFRDLSLSFYGYNRADARESLGIRDSLWLQGMATGMPAAYEGISAFSTDLTSDLGRLDVPTLFIHGDDDQLVPFSATARKAVSLVKDADLIVYPGGSHGICTTEKHRINADLLDFLAARPRWPEPRRRSTPNGR